MKGTIITTAVIITLLSVVSGQDTCPQLLVWLPILDNGEFVVHFMEQSSEAIVKYFCDEGYVLDGDATRSCVFDGITAKWVREDVPTCVRVCDKLTNPDNGCVLTTGTRTGETAVYLCDDGFTLKGEKKRKCGDNGEWDGTDPTCKSECGELDDPDYGCVVIAGNKPGDKAVYFCDDGFTMKGEKKRKCVDGGMWDGKAPTCKRMCPKLPHIPYGKVYTDGLKPGSTANYHCKYGYYLKGYKKRVCDEDGTWTYREPTCDKDDREKYAPWKKSYSSGSRRKSSRSYSSRSHKRYW